MSKRGFTLCAGAAVLLLVGLTGCIIQDRPADKPPEGTYSVDDLLANLDTLEGPAARGLAGRSIFTFAGGGQLSLRDLSSYLNAIKSGFSSFVSSTKNGPYLVTAVRLSWAVPGGSESGLMWVPFTWFRSKEFPVISYQHGTQVYRDVAPSRFNVNPLSVFSSRDQSGALQNYVECVVGALMASAGYIVVMPDYAGFGESTVTHPYVAKVLADSVVGALGAATSRLKQGRVHANGSLYLTGYSEGGYATMVASSAIGGQVTATIPADGPYDLSGTMLTQMLAAPPKPTPKVPWYLLYTAAGYHSLWDSPVYQDQYLVDMRSLLNDDGLGKLYLFDGTHTNAEIDSAVSADTYPRDFLEGSELYRLDSGGDAYIQLADNNGWKGWAPRGPVVLIHCPVDDVVPIENRDAAVDALGRAGFVPPFVTTVDVPPVPFIDTLLGSIHTAAYPTAMLAAVTAIRTINSEIR